jgi:diguanylate cyclase (GGDEF)-like protein
MEVSRIKRLRRVVGAFLRTDALDDRVRRILVNALYMKPISLTLGVACGSAASIVTAYVSGSPSMAILAAAVVMLAIGRVGAAYLLPRTERCSARALEVLYEIGAFGYAAAIGLIAVLAVIHDLSFSAQLLAVCSAVCYAAGVAPRSASRPAIAIGQLLIVLLPLGVTLAQHQDPALQTLAMVILLMIPILTSSTLSIFRMLRNSVSAAETSARLAEKMQALARGDVVTGLLNRAGLNHDLVERLAMLGPDDKFALFWMDLDKFKEVNDALGHQVGDRLLAEVARRLRDIAPAKATVARFGGDEFILAYPMRDRSEAEALARTMMEEISRPMRIDSNRLEIATSMGIAILPDDGADLDTLMQSADLALYRSKVNGRKQVSFFDPTMSRNLVRRREIEAELRTALQREELSICYQPVVDLATGRIRGFEALVRWFHPEKGELSPEEFIPVAEETGAIITLGNWITAQAARTAAAWPDHVTISVNLSPVQIKAPGAALAIMKALREAGLPPSRLELEITEMVLLDDSENTEHFIEELGNAGVSFALDDFGTGYSSLGYLNKYPFGKIKVDRSFVSGINVGAKSEAIIRAVSQMGSRLGMEIVAEGLETIEQVEAVREAGCTLGQGFYFSRAVPDYLAAALIAKECEAIELERKAG